jgi:hypothetical protein
VSDPLLRLVPGLREACETEARLRDDAFLGAPEFICGIEVEPLTLDRFILLNAFGSPFICGGRPVRADDVALFLWVLSPQYSRAMAVQRALWPLSRQAARGWLLVSRCIFVRRLRRLDAAQAIEAVQDYVDTALFDAPKGGSKRSGGLAYWSMFASIVLAIAAETGWTENAIRKMPVRRVWQYWRMVRVRKDPEAHVFNPLSGRVITEWQRSINGKARS